MIRLRTPSLGAPSTLLFAAPLVSAALLSACSIHALTGDMLTDYTIHHVTPYLMTTDDIGMACETGQSLGSQLLSYERVTDAPNEAGVTTLASAASCSEFEVWDAELRQIRAVRRGDTEEAIDARIAEKRWRLSAARRMLRAYHYLIAEYGEPGGACPKFEEDEDEVTWLIGLITAASAVQHDRATGGMMRVPLDVPIKAARGMECLDNKKWWGAPEALQAAVWLGVPGATPEGEDPWARLAEARAIGGAAGMRIAHVISAQAAWSAGKMDLVREIIHELAVSREQTQPPARFQLVDVTAVAQAEAMSDKIWTKATGHRTPLGEIGTFPTDEEAVEEEDDLLDSLGLEGPAPGAEDTNTDAGDAGESM